MKHSNLEKFIHDNLINEGWPENEFGVVSANMLDGGSCNLTYVISDVIRAYNKHLVESLGHAVAENGYDLEVDNTNVWWITHKHIGSGEPLLQFLNSEPINNA